MGNAFQDQFLKAGLVDEKLIKQANKEKYRDQKQGKHKTAATENQQALQRAKKQQAERDKALNRQRQEAAQQKALTAQVRQMIQTNRLPTDEGESPYHFSDGGQIKRLYVTDTQRDQLGRGQLAIAKLDGRYALIPRAVADKIRERDPASLIPIAETPTSAEDPEDPYAEYKVPDDLIW